MADNSSLTANVTTSTDSTGSSVISVVQTNVTESSSVTATVVTGGKGDKGDSGTTDYNELQNKPTIPDQLSDLSDDSTHRTVTDTEKSTWNAKQPAMGSDDNYVTDAEKANLHAPHSDDQDLSALALKSNVLELDNTTPFTPDADYEPATKKYVDDNAGGGTPGGSDTQVQFNDDGSFGGDSGFTYNKTTNYINLGDNTYPGGVHCSNSGSITDTTIVFGVPLETSTVNNTDAGTNVAVIAGQGGDSSGKGGDVTVIGGISLMEYAGDAQVGGGDGVFGGDAYIFGGNSSDQIGGDVTVHAGDGINGGHIEIFGGSATNPNDSTPDGDGGDIFIFGGDKIGTGVPGNVELGNPGKVGIQKEDASIIRAWFDAQTLTADHTFAFPDKDGTFATTDDIPTTTADIAASTDKNYVTDAELTVIGNTSGTNTGDQVGDGVTITGTGTVADPFVSTGGDISGLVPYTGATSDVELGTFGINTPNINATGGETTFGGNINVGSNSVITPLMKGPLDSGITFSGSDASENTNGSPISFVGSTGGAPTSGDTNGGDIIFTPGAKNGATGSDGKTHIFDPTSGIDVAFDTSLLTTSTRVVSFPDKSGTMAMLDDISGGTGDVSKVGTPVDNQIGVWTGDGTIEGDSTLTYDGTDKTISIGQSPADGKYSLLKGKLGFAEQTPVGILGSERVIFEDPNGLNSDWAFRVAGGGNGAISFASSNGTLSSPTDSDANDFLGELNFYGYDTGSYVKKASIAGYNNGTIGIDGNVDLDTNSIKAASAGLGKAANANIRADILNTSGGQGLRIENPASNDIGFSTYVTGDNYVRFNFAGDGSMEWGAGSTVADTNLYRSAANTLKTDDNFVANNIAAGATVSGSNTGDQTLPTDATLSFTDVTTNNASTSAHGFAPKATAPASGLFNYVGITNGETVYTNKALFDATVPSTQAFGDAAAVGSATVAARRDHKHAMPATPKDTTAVTGMLKGNGTSISAASAGTDYVSPTGNETVTNKVVTNVGTGAPATPATGMLWWDSDEPSYATSVLSAVYPVGCIYTEITGVNPATTFGFGTWSEYGQGRVLVSHAASGTFNVAAGTTGGAETVTLTAAQSGVPAHTHSVPAISGTGNAKWGPTAVSNPTNNAISADANTAADASQSHTNLQPYIVVYMWNRTA